MTLRYTNKTVVQTLVLLLGWSLSMAEASPKRIQQAQQDLAALQTQYRAQPQRLVKLESELSRASQLRDKANQELIDKKTDFIQVSQDLDTALARYHATPSSETKRMVDDLARSKTLTEKMVSRRQLEVQRTQRRYDDIVEKIDSVKKAQVRTRQEIRQQQARINDLKQAVTAQAIAQAEARKARIAETANQSVTNNEAVIDPPEQSIAARGEIIDPAAQPFETTAVAEQSAVTLELESNPAEPSSEATSASTAPSSDQPDEAPTLQEQIDAINRASDDIFTTGW